MSGTCQFPLICIQGSLWRFIFLVNRKFGVVFDSDIADIRWFGILIFKDSSFVNRLTAFVKIDETHLILIKKIGNVPKLIPCLTLMYSISRSINWIVRWERNIFTFFELNHGLLTANLRTLVVHKRLFSTQIFLNLECGDKISLWGTKIGMFHLGFRWKQIYSLCFHFNFFLIDAKKIHCAVFRTRG